MKFNCGVHTVLWMRLEVFESTRKQYVLEKFGRESDERCRELVGRVVNCIAGECGWLLNFVCSCCLEYT